MALADESRDISTHAKVTVSAEPKKQGHSLLLCLPTELLDLVLLLSLELSTNLREMARPGTSTQNLFRCPALHLNRELRNKTLDIIATETLWVSVVANTKKASAWLLDVSMKYLPVLPAVYRDALRDRPLDRICMSFGNSVEQGDNSTANKGGAPLRVEILFNWTSFLRLVMEMFHYGRVEADVRVQLPLSCVSWKRNFCVTHIQPIFRLSAWPWYRFHSQESTKLNTLSLLLKFDQSAGGRFSLGQVFRTLRAIRRFADDLEVLGSQEEAVLWLCYIGSIRYGHPQAILPGAFEWSHGEFDIDPERIIVREPAPGRNPLGNEIRTILHELEYRACIGFWNLYQEYGLDFISTHHIGLLNQGCRWRTSPSYSSFGLSDKERGEWHHLKAVDLHNRVNVYTKFAPSGAWLQDPYRDRHSVNNGFLACGMHYHSIKNMEIACSLQPENDHYKAFLQELLNAGVEYSRRFPEDPNALKMGCMPKSSTRPTPMVLPADIAAEAGITHWIGDAWAFGSSGTFLLRYLPLARKRLTEEQIRKLEEGTGELFENSSA